MRREAAAVLVGVALLAGCGGNAEDRTVGCDDGEKYLQALIDVTNSSAGLGAQAEAYGAMDKALEALSTSAPSDVQEAAEILRGTDVSSLKAAEQQAADDAQSTVTDWLVVDCGLAPPN